MYVRNPRITIAVLLSALVAGSFFVIADERKCTASPNECERQIRQMLSGRRYLGLDVVELNPGIVIKGAKSDGPASRADLRPGDRIIAVNGRSMNLAGIKEFKQVLADARDTGTLFMIIQRRGGYRKVEIRLEPYPKAQIDKIVATHLSQSHIVAGRP